jgi:hypothetical protein
MHCANPECDAVSKPPQNRSRNKKHRPAHIVRHGQFFWVCDNCLKLYGFEPDALESPGEKPQAMPSSSTAADLIQGCCLSRGSESELSLISGAAEVRGILTSWKEIAGYLGKGVRTVQRWECCFGLPVRRPINNNRHTAIMAIREEIDLWVGTKTRTRKPRSQQLEHQTADADR